MNRQSSVESYNSIRLLESPSVPRFENQLVPTLSTLLTQNPGGNWQLAKFCLVFDTKTVLGAKSRKIGHRINVQGFYLGSRSIQNHSCAQRCLVTSCAKHAVCFSFHSRPHLFLFVHSPFPFFSPRGKYIILDRRNLDQSHNIFVLFIGGK